MKALLFAVPSLGVALLAGCANVAWQASAGTPAPVHPTTGLHVQVSSFGSSAAAFFGVAILGAIAYESTRGEVQFTDLGARPPEMAPDRKVSEQDCTKPLDFTLGNIRCK